MRVFVHLRLFAGNVAIYRDIYQIASVWWYTPKYVQQILINIGKPHALTATL